MFCECSGGDEELRTIDKLVIVVVDGVINIRRRVIVRAILN